MVRIALLSLVLLSTCASLPRYRKGPPPKANNPPSRPSTDPANPDAPAVKVSTKGAYQVGFASYYAHKFHGRPTASGEIFDMYGISAAHRELPLGTIVRVTHLGNGRSVDAKVNDRGPFIPGRILDLSLGAARRLDMVEEGVAEVKIEILSRPD